MTIFQPRQQFIAAADTISEMSAILVAFNRNGKPVEREVLECMMAARPERAVDGQNIWLGGFIGLAHQHFWITPEEMGEIQPFEDETGRYVIACDARIDNRQEIANALVLDATQAHKLSDADLVLRTYQRWENRCVEFLVGEFVFAIWDKAKEELFIARDILGVRGLSYYLSQELFLVASEISQILAHPAVQRRLNDSKVAQFLTNLQDESQSFYSDVLYCPPAHCMLVTRTSSKIWRYWEINPEAQVRYRDDREYAEHYLTLLKEVVRCRLRTTGRVGISLSGGLDSATLTALIANALPEAGLKQPRLKSFSYVFDELAACDERRYIQPLVEQYDLEATYIVADNQWTLRDFPNWPNLSDFIHHDAFAGLYYTVLDAAQSQGCQLLFTGILGDTLYYRSEQYWVASMILDRRIRQLFQTLQDECSFREAWHQVLAYGLRPLVPAWGKRVYRMLRPAPKPWQHPALHPDFVQRAGLRQGFAQPYQPHFPHPHQRQVYANLTLNLYSQGMAAVRHVHNARRLERLDPFYDPRLITYLLALPADQLGRPYRTRWVLRNAIQGLLPPSLRERKDKANFYPLMEKGLLHKELTTVKKILKKPKIVEYKYIREEWLQETLRSFQGSPESTLFFLWQCICLELWLQRYW